MQIIRINKKDGIVKVRTETPDDLWHLEKVLELGDLVTSRTLRKTTIKRGQEIEKGDRKPVTLTIGLEKKEFHKSTHTLRLNGPIKSGPEDLVQLGSYHSLSIGINTILTIQKEWKSHQLERLKKARIKPSLLLICVLDREEADFAELKESGLEFLASFSSVKHKDKDTLEEYHKEITDYLEGKQKDFQAIVLAGPGFERENLLKYIKEKNPDLAKRIFLEHSNSTGRAGIQEVIKTSANRILKDTRIARETELVEKMLQEINKDGPTVYGKKETMKAVEYGAIETLLVSEESIPDFEEIMDKVEKQCGNIRIISSDHESGEKFLNLGGIAGFLRFKIRE
ncbi:MAG: mRNA surveillance protein pelota [Candidatus Aenigmatarchaeota archaeon]|nr:MAG: mRNA surveillance protein pelota [Candidatus Aenigmarchaeota archaeon]